MEEKFESIAELGYPNLAVSRQGHVFSYDKHKNKILKGSISDCGYLRVCIKDATGKFTTYNVHRLIAQHFIPNPENKPQVNHIDGNKLNNCVENLEWVTNLENAHHAMLHGLMPHVKFDESIVKEICLRFCQGYSCQEIAEDLNVPFTSVAAIRCKRNWTHISRMYPFPPTFDRSRELNDKMVHQICHDLIELKNVSRRVAIISKRYGINRDTIQKIACGKNWKSITAGYPELFQ